MTNTAQFRSDFPEFSDTTVYPDSSVTLWMTVATSLVNARRWMELTDIGIELVTAHHLVLSKRDQDASDAGGTPGEIKGPTMSKSVDKVSVGYDSGAATLTDAGFWNLTTYGVRFYTLALSMGAGGLQV
ncbi:DUF4054 domain-containing protein [Paraburkholderia sp. Ac-20342]|uniref:DUF4054 domain-containing protein n=1 Tax=Paraburkholderia sp. Ac-20342 TaxID=2703889 RepID=UPI001981DE10|nr:DUF4054 domain-containing protein [Paraburkholderia sp. Ac-20342]MBN3848629.1 DUF4054 domain-containing protein [Paraburkholderia sp. Ac-20342]